MWESVCGDKVSRRGVSIPRGKNIGLRNHMMQTAREAGKHAGKDVEMLLPFGEQTASHGSCESAQSEIEMDGP